MIVVVLTPVGVSDVVAKCSTPWLAVVDAFMRERNNFLQLNRKCQNPGALEDPTEGVQRVGEQKKNQGETPGKNDGAPKG